jgi:DNA-binding NtrC family response regulator
MSVVAVINSNADTVEMLRLALQQARVESVTAPIEEIKRGLLDFPRFLEEHAPRVVIYDIPPPYDQNWEFLRLLRTTEAMRARAVVVTTTHKGHLEKLVGPTDAIEIIGKPYDLDQVIRAVRQALGQE